MSKTKVCVRIEMEKLMKISLPSVVMTIVMAFVLKILVSDGFMNTKTKRNPAASVLQQSVKTVKS